MSEEQLPLFEVISRDEYRKESTTRATGRRQPKTEPRTQTVWFALPTHPGFCTIPEHDEVQKMLKPEQIPYRYKYPSRQVYEIREGIFACRDCFLAGADKES